MVGISRIKLLDLFKHETFNIRYLVTGRFSLVNWEPVSGHVAPIGLELANNRLYRVRPSSDWGSDIPWNTAPLII